MGEVQQQLPPDVKLPEHGGFAAYFVDAGGYFEVVTGHKRNAAQFQLPQPVYLTCSTGSVV